MRDALFVAWYGFMGLWEDFVLLCVLNLGWSILVVLPFASLFLLGGTQPMLALILGAILLAPLAIYSGALCFVANQSARGKVLGWGMFVEGVRRYWVKALVVASVNVVVVIMMVANIQFYAVVLQGAWTNYAVAIWVALGIYWLLVQIFWFPMILELESERILVGLRSAAFMVAMTPGFSLMLILVLVLLAALFIVLTLPAALLMASLFLLIVNHATRSRLAHAQKVPYQPGAHKTDA